MVLGWPWMATHSSRVRPKPPDSSDSGGGVPLGMTMTGGVAVGMPGGVAVGISAGSVLVAIAVRTRARGGVAVGMSSLTGVGVTKIAVPVMMATVVSGSVIVGCATAGD